MGDEEFFKAFMTKHLGQNYAREVNDFHDLIDPYYNKKSDGDGDDDEIDLGETTEKRLRASIDEDILELFSNPNDIHNELKELRAAGIGSRLESGAPTTILSDDDDNDDNDDNDDGNIAQRLFLFTYNNEIYSLVRLLIPPVVLGRECPDGMARMILLTPEERNRVLPRLEDKVTEAYELAQEIAS